MGKARRASGESSHDVVSLVADVLAQAARLGASDVHFDRTAAEVVVRFRLNGVLETVERLPAAIGDNIISRLKVLSGLLTYRCDIPQEGRIDGNDAPGVLESRVAVFPTIRGERAVVRFFYEEAGLSELSNLGLPAHIDEALRRIAGSSQGLLLLTGPAGSGKSTTLAAMLRHISRTWPGRSIVTLEDPVERNIDGVTQVQISPHGAMTFPKALRSLLRQDPEVLMIGEIRDAQTAAIAVEAGLTGHLVMSTLHSGSPGAALVRLLEMGLEPYQITSTVSGVVSQRLLRRLCERCKRRGDDGWESVGCESCAGTGFSGRLPAAEMAQLDGSLRKAVLAKADRDTIEDALARSGHMTLRQHAQQLAAAGLTTAREVERLCAGAD